MNFQKRNGLHSNILYGEAGSVNRELTKEGTEEFRVLCREYPAKFILNVDETGIKLKIVPRHTYRSPMINHGWKVRVPGQKIPLVASLVDSGWRKSSPAAQGMVCLYRVLSVCTLLLYPSGVVLQG